MLLELLKDAALYLVYGLIALLIVGVIFSLIIESIKQLIGDENIEKIFDKKSYFAAIVSLIVGILFVITFCAFYLNITWLYIIIIVFWFLVFCFIGSQLGYFVLVKRLTKFAGAAGVDTKALDKIIEEIEKYISDKPIDKPVEVN